MNREEALAFWDVWRQDIASGCQGSSPRDGFESVLDDYDERIAALEAENAALKARVVELEDILDRLDDLLPVSVQEILEGGE